MKRFLGLLQFWFPLKHYKPPTFFCSLLFLCRCVEHLWGWIRWTSGFRLVIMIKGIHNSEEHRKFELLARKIEMYYLFFCNIEATHLILKGNHSFKITEDANWMFTISDVVPERLAVGRVPMWAGVTSRREAYVGERGRERERDGPV